jgi:Ni/Fe-hydrogenase subunit HybB-like protein
MATLEQNNAFQLRLERTVLAPLQTSSGRYYALVGVLGLAIAWGVFAYGIQLRDGLWATGMRDRISWGLYIALFVFFIGVSMAGTMVSAVLRITGAAWRTPITRIAEVITVAALVSAGVFIVVDMGRPDRLYNLLFYGRWRSPITWDVYGINIYVTGSLLYLYLAAVPDLAICRDAFNRRAQPMRARLYDIMSVGWRGTVRQRRLLGIGMGVMMIVIIPIAVSMHTVTSLIFATTLRESWRSTMFPAFFVAGALYSGTGMIIIVTAMLRKVVHLEEYLTIKHFKYLGYILAVTALMVVFFNLSEYTVIGFQMTEGDAFYFRQLLEGVLAPYYWTYAVVGIIIPVLLVLIPRTRTLAGITLAAVLANVGMLLERYIIVVGGFRVPTMPYEPPSYTPTWVEMSVAVGGFALFALIIVMALKVLPSIAMEETTEQHELKAQGSSPERIADAQ